MFMTESSARDRFGRPSNKSWSAPAVSRTLQLFCYQFSFQLIRCWLVSINVEWIVLFSPRALIRIANPDIIIIVREGRKDSKDRKVRKGRKGMKGRMKSFWCKKHIQKEMQYILKLNQFYTVCPGSIVTIQKKYSNIFASEN